MSLRKLGEYLPRTKLDELRGIEFWWDPFSCSIDLMKDNALLKTVGLEELVNLRKLAERDQRG